jgi:hypothetical protein
LPGCQESLLGLRDPAWGLKLVENWCCCQRIGGGVPG